ncbi:MAG: polyphosphate kinase 1 [Coriobacteriia bacterium]|nr:polyphosphate kinase 1 [Coriobacteriia bacterium]
MPYDFSYTQNRELSWLRFNERVLEESTDTSVPLYERLKFVSIFTSNLDEFFMVRVGGLNDLSLLKTEPVDNKSNQTPSQQLESIFEAMPRLYTMRAESFKELEENLENYQIKRLTPDTLSPEQFKFVNDYVQSFLLPILNPQIIESRHPFPNLKNLGLYCAFILDTKEDKGLLGMIEVPQSEARVIYLPGEDSDNLSYILIEDAILACAAQSFGEVSVVGQAVIRLTRNADIDPDEVIFDEDDNYRQHMKRVLKKRMRLQPVRLEIQGELDPKIVKQIRKTLDLQANQVIYSSCPVEQSYIWEIEDHIPGFLTTELLYEPFSPQPSIEFDPHRSVTEQIYAQDKLLWYPYESMTPFLELIHEAAFDPEVISIKITLYRIAKKSKLAESLIAAAENGKEVTVLMELRARFDEENNIIWAERLEDAGCTVTYGQEGFKVHSKICQITRRVDGHIIRLTQLGTGNYNEKTAGIYSDFSYMTADDRIGDDANTFFRNMSIGNLNGTYNYLGVAPSSLKPLIMMGINKEIFKAKANKPAGLIFKMNSLTDRDVIDKLVEASQAGVDVKLIIRGICCLLPGIPGKTERIEVRSIAGRFLEHARVYAFGVNADRIYLSSADMMTRNTEHRVEIAYPILDVRLRQMVMDVLQVQLKDNVKARILGADGIYRKVERGPEEAEFISQEYFMDVAKQNAAQNNLSDEQMTQARKNVARRSMVTSLNLSENDLSNLAPSTQQAQTKTADDADLAEEPQSFTDVKYKRSAGASAEASPLFEEHLPESFEEEPILELEVEELSERTAENKEASDFDVAENTTLVRTHKSIPEGRFARFGKYLSLAFKALFGKDK